MGAIQINLASPQLRRHARLFASTVQALINALVMVNRITLRSNRNIPPLYSSGVRYQREPRGQEHFRDITTILESPDKVGDCEDLCAWRCAELQEAGENATIRVKWHITRRGIRMFHIQVRRGNGSIEDPSRILGM